MPEQDADASEVDEPKEVSGVALPSIRQPPVVEQPGKEPFDLPAPGVASQGSAILGGVALTIRTVRRNQFDSSLFAKPLVERIAVISSVSNKEIGCVLEKPVVDRLFDERDFMRRSTRNLDGDRKTLAVCDYHDLPPLPPLRFPDARAPFFGPCKGAVDERFADVDPTSHVEILRQGVQDPLHRPIPTSLLEVAMTGLVRRIAVWQIRPLRSRSKHPERAIQHLA